jgi:CelD/BcsL family acetyltransferase involved in cellulose biosynthesis
VGTAITSRPDTKSFYESLAAWAADNGWLRLWLLRLDGRAIAFALDLAAENVYYGLKVGYDPEFARFSPGMILQHETVRYAFDHELERFEFLGADEPYKLNWTKTCRDRLAVRVYPRGLRGTSAWFGRAVARPAVRKLRARIAEGRASRDGAG